MYDIEREILRNIGLLGEEGFIEGSGPHIEVDYDPWVEWVSEHERRKLGYNSMEIFDFPWFAASPFGGLGYHEG